MSLSLLIGDEIKALNDGRQRCRWNGCSTILSRRNPNKYCFVHVTKGFMKDEDKERAETYAKQRVISKKWWKDRKARLAKAKKMLGQIKSEKKK